MSATTNSPAQGDVVVGVDTSPSGRGALTWAAQYARVTGQRLRVLHVFSYRAAGGVVWTSGGLPPAIPAGGSDQVREPAEDELRSAFALLTPEPDWRIEFWGGSIGPTLVAQASEADLLVVGTREHTGVDRVLSGSVSHYCLSHAKCPIVAVPPTPVAVENIKPIVLQKSTG